MSAFCGISQWYSIPMTTNTIHDIAEKWLPIPLPDYKDCPPSVQETMRDPNVIGAQRYFQAMVERDIAAAAVAEQSQRLQPRRPANRRKRKH